MKVLFHLIGALLVVSCTTEQSRSISLERTLCLGGCAEYRIAIAADRRIEYSGDGFAIDAAVDTRMNYSNGSMHPNAGTSRFAAVAALLAGVAWVVWAVLNTRLHGGLDVGAAAVGERMALAGTLLMVGWNLLLIPAALVLHASLVDANRFRVRLATACGLASLLLWAYGGATRSITSTLEVSYIALSAVWWCGIGATLWPNHKLFGGLTIVLGAFTSWDALLTALSPVPFTLYLTAAPKLPLSILWDFALGYFLIRGVAGPGLFFPGPSFLADSVEEVRPPPPDDRK